MSKPLPSPSRSRPRVLISGVRRDMAEYHSLLQNLLGASGLVHDGLDERLVRPGSGIARVLDFVGNCDAFIGLIGRTYGYVPSDPTRNPRGLSLTELQFDEAVRWNIPILLFAHEAPPPEPGEPDVDAADLFRRTAFLHRAEEQGLWIHKFHRLEDFAPLAVSGITELTRLLLDRGGETRSRARSMTKEAAPTHRRKGSPGPVAEESPSASDLSASEGFPSREAELEALSRWAGPDDPASALLLEGPVGVGKSELVRRWITQFAGPLRSDWAGQFDFSFLWPAQGMAEFCRRAVSRMTDRPLTELRKRPARDLGKELLSLLQSRPWLLVLDDLERLAAGSDPSPGASASDDVQRSSAVAAADPSPVESTRAEDRELLRALVQASPSKVLLIGRRIPAALLGSDGQLIPGVRHIHLDLPLPNGTRPPPPAKSPAEATDDKDSPAKLPVDVTLLPRLLAQLASLDPGNLPLAESPNAERFATALASRSLTVCQKLRDRICELSGGLEPDPLWQAWFGAAHRDFLATLVEPAESPPAAEATASPRTRATTARSPAKRAAAKRTAKAAAPPRKTATTRRPAPAKKK